MITLVGDEPEITWAILEDWEKNKVLSLSSNGERLFNKHEETAAIVISKLLRLFIANGLSCHPYHIARYPVFLVTKKHFPQIP